MRHLGGPSSTEEVAAAHRRRLGDPWWLVIVAEPDGPAAGTIGVWETEHDSETLFETGWTVRPGFQGRGIASAALALLLDRVRAEPRFESIHAFPGIDNGPSNRLCRKFGFTLLGDARFRFRGHELHCHHWRLETPGSPSPPAAPPGATPGP